MGTMVEPPLSHLHHSLRIHCIPYPHISSYFWWFLTWKKKPIWNFFLRDSKKINTITDVFTCCYVVSSYMLVATTTHMKCTQGDDLHVNSWRSMPWWVLNVTSKCLMKMEYSRMCKKNIKVNTIICVKVLVFDEWVQLYCEVLVNCL